MRSSCGVHLRASFIISTVIAIASGIYRELLAARGVDAIHSPLSYLSPAQFEEQQTRRTVKSAA